MAQPRQQQRSSGKPVKLTGKAGKGPVIEGVKKGKPVDVPPRDFPRPRGGSRLNCSKCKITSVNNQQVPAGKTNAVAYIAEDTKTFTITATRQPADCSCTWSNVNIEFVAIATGAAARIKRKNFKFDQIVEIVTVNPNRRNPYFTVNECSLTLKISQLNDDLRRGINTENVFFQGVVTLIKVGVKCNSMIFTLYLNITDK
ncbi:MAG: hypothetical protein ACT4OT_05980 [Acidobacteriota bacterium]